MAASSFRRWFVAAAIALASALNPASWSQVLTENFGAATLNPALWFQDKTIANMSAVQTGGQLQFRSTVNNTIPEEAVHYVATALEPGISVVSGSQVSVRINLSKAPSPSQANYDEGLAVCFARVDTELEVTDVYPEGILFLVGAYTDIGLQRRYMRLLLSDGLGVEEDVMYAEELTPGRFQDEISGTVITVPASGPFTAYFSLVKGASESVARVGFSGFTGTSNAVSFSLSAQALGNRPYRAILAGYVAGPIRAALTGTRSYFDDFVVQQGALSYRPKNLVASQGASTTAVNLTWSAPTAVPTGTTYKVFKTSNLSTPIATVSGLSYADTSATAGVPTEYAVCAYSATTGLSEASDYATGFRKAPAPTVTAVTPVSGPLAGGTTITVTGTNLRMASAVKVGTASATNVVVNSAGTSLTAKTPAGTAGAKSVSVTTPSGTATKASAFTYFAVPTVTAVSPAAGPLAGGTTITVTGTNLLGTTSVKVGTAAATAVVVNSAGTSLTAKTPSGTAGAKSVSVTTPGGTATKASAFTHMAAPTIGTVTPSSGPTAGNTTITVSGTNFRAGLTTVKIGTTLATNVVVNSAGTSLTAKTPAGTAGAKSVVVTAPGGTATKANGFTYVAGAGMPAGGGSGSGSGGGSAAGMPAFASSGTGTSVATTSRPAGTVGSWQPTTGVPAVDVFLVIAGSGATVRDSECGEVPVTDLDGNGESDLCQLRRGDLDLDGDVDDADAELILALAGRESPDGIADLDGDGWVTTLDAAAARPTAPTLGSSPR
jgi:hypothetical protein